VIKNREIVPLEVSWAKGRPKVTKLILRIALKQTLDRRVQTSLAGRGAVQSHEILGSPWTRIRKTATSRINKRIKKS
jgi:hypothetical protein